MSMLSTRSARAGAVCCDGDGGRDRAYARGVPVPGPGEVLVEGQAAGTTRAERA